MHAVENVSVKPAILNKNQSIVNIVVKKGS